MIGGVARGGNTLCDRGCGYRRKIHSTIGGVATGLCNRGRGYRRKLIGVWLQEGKWEGANTKLWTP